MIARWPRRGLQLAGVAVALLLLAATIDYALTTAALPEFDPSFEFDPASPALQDPAVAERGRLIDGYGDRVWLYALGLLAVAAALTVAALRATPPEGRRELFTDLGVAGVVCGLAAAVIASGGPALIDNSNQGAVLWVPAAGLLLAAGAGSLILRAGGRVAPAPAGERPADARAAEPLAHGSALGSSQRIVSWAALGLTVLTVVLVVIAHDGRECGVKAPGWSDTLLWISLIAGAAAGICGLAALLARRWVVTLLSIPAPVIALYGIVAATCLS